MKHLDLFSGIGGFALAADWCWGDKHEVVAFCDNEPFTHKVLKKNWPNIPIINDIRKLNRKDYDFGTVDLLTGGFPCQPFSVAGKQKGKEDDRFLWPEMLRVIAEYRPTWIIGENVAGIINLALDQVLSDLEGQGYATRTFIIPACAVNAPHRRDRVWIVAYSRCEHGERATEQGKHEKSIGKENASESKRSVKCNQSGIASDANNRRSQEQEQQTTGYKQCDRNVANTTNSGLKEVCGRQECSNENDSNANSKGLQGGIQQGQGEGSQSGHKQSVRQDREGVDSNSESVHTQRQHDRQRKREFGRKSWEQNWYEVASKFCRVDDGVPNRVDRLKGLGNAIVPQVAYEIMCAIKEYECDMSND